MNTLQFLAPLFVGMCVNNFMEKQGDLCNVRQSNPNVVKYYQPGKSCYRDGVFYPRCEDLENKEVQYYHNQFYGTK